MRRITAGEWLGPWTLCHTLQEVVNRAHPVGLHVHLANTPGGGAPVLYTDRFACSFCRYQQCIAILGADTKLPCSIKEVFLGSTNKDAASGGLAQRGVLLLIPLVLGLGKVNPASLRAVHSLALFSPRRRKVHLLPAGKPQVRAAATGCLAVASERWHRGGPPFQQPLLCGVSGRPRHFP